ncbi:Cyclic dehypoxanthine futalosine synthase [Candidatus Syntrophocurvum alkaliphilum]|uniref:Cyclic dehypoxanthine futalosine synthase n=1 Tax=Candidatus Syntrophocurvum alkaliphilum TaxID=2293317 RepID=A0A6I6DG10_9FIRM|nr:cyclic dehypoxanthinyl futalosine synthase [Candidatus Syntrophocurvum alkaliphilum]QGT99313.1 Cyclic dehypoxanthine futalosine synthase [Candidatus Syntrophocurvum alkaliphilum]
MKTSNILNEVIKGKKINKDEFLYLYKYGDLLEIAQAANKVRDSLVFKDKITFVVDRNINYTNICSCRCKFCAFYCDKSDSSAYVIEKNELFAKIEEAIELGASQLMIQGGLNDNLKIDYFEDMFKSIKSKFDITIHSLSAPEIFYIANISNLTINETLQRLKKAGLDSLPGGGAEILHDEIRNKISPNKINTNEWLDVMKKAHHLGMKSTATMMIGSVENIHHRLYHLEKIRQLQEETGGFRAFIVWTYQPGNNDLRGSKVTSIEYLRFLALSRLYLNNITHIQGSWVTQGKKIGQLSIHFGADDLGSIMIEENVVRSAGVAYKMDKQEMIELIKATGKVPAIRDTEYKIKQLF